ncbi:MAG: FG-GAP repeat domain-containing protein, partial [Nostoc sp.]
SPTVLSVLINAGNGTFLPPVGYSVGGDPYPIAIGDFNGDGKLDVITGNDQSNDLSLLIGLGNGTFEPEVRLGAGNDPYGLAVGDFNGDGQLDIVGV